METDQYFIITREHGGCTGHAVIRRAAPGWAVAGRCSCTESAFAAARNLANIFGGGEKEIELVPAKDHAKATAGYTAARRMKPGFSVWRITNRLRKS